MKFAILSDIHGNSFALEAILEDLEKRKVDQVFNLGDILYGPIAPAKTYTLLQNVETISISGNQDRIILEQAEGKNNSETMNFVLDELNGEALEYLRSLPYNFHHDNAIYLCHGSPKRDDEYLVERLQEGFVDIKANIEIEDALRDISESIVVCGHSHKFHLIKTGTKTVINPGSVGLQAYDDDSPIYHKMENYHTNTRYCVLNIEEDISVDFISLPYDFESAAKLAEKNSRPDWARWLRTGRA